MQPSSDGYIHYFFVHDRSLSNYRCLLEALVGKDSGSCLALLYQKKPKKQPNPECLKLNLFSLLIEKEGRKDLLMKFSRIELQTLAGKMLTLSWLESELKHGFSVQFGAWANKS